MKFSKTDFEGLFIISPELHFDERGYFMESFNKFFFDKIMPHTNFVQDNISYSKKGVLRGLHFQRPPYAQIKLVKCIKGKVLDIALDLRKDSQTYGKVHTKIISDEDNYQLLIPSGFAHGYLVLSDSAIFSYKIDKHYSKEYESGVYYNDPKLNINYTIDNILVSEKDNSLPNLEDINSPF